jgi:FHA domain
MAAVMYRCPVDGSCPEASQPGFCAKHPDTRLERARPRVAAVPDAAQVPAQVQSGSGLISAHEPASHLPVPLIAVRYLGNSVQIPASGLILGRDTTPTLELPGQVSRVHAHLHWDGLVLRVTDVNSANRTFVDGQLVEQSEAVQIKPGQTLRLGEDVELAVVEIEIDEFGRPR